MMRILMTLGLIALTGCAVTPVPAPVCRSPQRPCGDDRPSPKQAVDNFITVVERVEPVAEALCRVARHR